MPNPRSTGCTTAFVARASFHSGPAAARCRTPVSSTLGVTGRAPWQAMVDPAAYAWSGETVSIGGEPVGELSSVGWGWAAGRCVALGYVRGDAAAMPHAGTPVTVDLWGEAVGARAWDRWAAQTL